MTIIRTDEAQGFSCSHAKSNGCACAQLRAISDPSTPSGTCVHGHSLTVVCEECEECDRGTRDRNGRQIQPGDAVDTIGGTLADRGRVAEIRWPDRAGRMIVVRPGHAQAMPRLCTGYDLIVIEGA